MSKDIHPCPSLPPPCFVLRMLEGRARDRAPGLNLEPMKPSSIAGTRGVSLVQVQDEGLGIIRNPSTAPLLGTGVDVDEEGAFLPAKAGSGAPRASWSFNCQPSPWGRCRTERSASPWRGVDEDEAREDGEGGRQAARSEYDHTDAFVSYSRPAASSFRSSPPPRHRHHRSPGRRGGG